MTGGRAPRLSIGLPVFNGEGYLEAALECLLGQSFGDFELVVADNASTDATPAILDRYAARDDRIRVLRQPENIGAAPNFNAALAASSLQCAYFKWAAHDDLLRPDYLERCVAALDGDPGLVLCHSRVVRIDADGVEGDEYPQLLADAASPSPLVRFRALTCVKHPCFDVFGVVRRDALTSTRGIQSFISSDRVLLAELALRGRYGWIDEPLFLSRDHSDRSIRRMSVRERAAWFDSSARRRRLVLPFWSVWRGHAGALFRAPLPWRVRLRGAGVLLRWGLLNALDLARDLKWLVWPKRPSRPARG